MTASIEISAICPVADHLRLAVDFSTSTQAATNEVPGMAFLLDENSVYQVDVYAIVSSAATTTGFFFGATAPSGSTMHLTTIAPSATTGTGDIQFAEGTTLVFTTTPSNSNGGGSPTVKSLAVLHFLIQTGADSASPTSGQVGFFQLTFGTEVSASPVNLWAGSCMVLRKMSQAAASAMVTLQAPGFDASYSVTESVVSQAATAKLIVTYKADGSWRLTDHAGTLADSGNWGAPTTPGAGSSYELRISPSAQSGGTVSNGAPNWTTISGDIVFSLTVTSTGGDQSATVLPLFEVRQRGTVTVGSTGSTTLTVTASAEQQ